MSVLLSGRLSPPCYPPIHRLPWTRRTLPGCRLAACCLSIALSAAVAHAAPPGADVKGDWITPDNSALRIASCGGDLCIHITRLPPDNKFTTDGLNPDKQLRQRPLCGLVIGRGFHAAGPGRAEGGSLYDPKSGKTYQGSMMVDGDRLRLRGYVGVKLFGRTEVWKRSTQPIAACTNAS